MTEIHQYVRNNNWFLNLRFASISRIPFVDSRSLFFAFGVCVCICIFRKNTKPIHMKLSHIRVSAKQKKLYEPIRCSMCEAKY